MNKKHLFIANILLLSNNSFAKDQCNHQKTWKKLSSDQAIFCNSYGQYNKKMICQHSGASIILSKDETKAWCQTPDGVLSLAVSKDSENVECEDNDDDIWKEASSAEDGSKIAVKCRHNVWGDSKYNILICPPKASVFIHKDATAAWCLYKDESIALSTDYLFANNGCHRTMDEKWYNAKNFANQSIAAYCRNGEFKKIFSCDSGEVLIADNQKSVICVNVKENIVSLDFSHYQSEMICPENMRKKWHIGTLKGKKVGFYCNSTGEYKERKICYEGKQPTLINSEVECK